MTDQEINEAVARKLGWIKMEAYIPPRWIIPNAHPASNCPSEVPNYCNDIKAAWEIVEHLAKGNWCVEISHENTRDLWQCVITNLPDSSLYETSDTAPMAICLAFLELEG